MRSRRTLLAAASLAVVAAIGGGAWWWTQREPPAASLEAPSPVGTPGQAEAAAQALKQLQTDPAALLPAGLAGELNATVTQAVPIGTTVSADPATWLPSAAGGGVIEAHLRYPDGNVETLAVVMVLEGDSWKVLQTIPVEGAP